MIWHPATNLFVPSLPEGFIPPSPPADRRMRAEKRLKKHMTTYTGRVLCPGSAEYAVELSRIGSAGGMSGGMQGLDGLGTALLGANTPPISTPTAFWRMEEASGSRVDSVGGSPSCDLTATGAPSNTTGKIGSALAVTPTAYCEILDNARIRTGTSFTLA